MEKEIGKAVLLVLIPFLFQAAVALPAPLEYPDIPGKAMTTDTAEMSFHRNPLGIHALPPSPRTQGEVRGMLIGNGWVAAHALGVDETMASRLGYYLSDLTGKKFNITNAGFDVDTPLESMPQMQALLTAYKPDYVYFYFAGGPQLVTTAALDELIERDAEGKVLATHFITDNSLIYRALDKFSALSSEQKRIWLRLLNLQVGMIEAGRRISDTANQADEMLKPVLRILQQYKTICAQNGARFVLLWPASALYAANWKRDAPSGLAFWALDWLNPLKYPISATREQFLEVLRKQDISTVVNFEVGPYLYSVWQDPATKAKPYLSVYKENLDQVAKLFATSILAQDL